MRSVKRTVAIISLVAAVIAVSGSPASAHHSFGRYDMSQLSEIEGSVHKFEWSNPHSWLFVDVVKEGEAPVTYGFELPSVGEMLRRGWTKTAVKPGEKVKVKFRPLHDGNPAGLLVSAEKDGKRIGNSEDAPPAEPPIDKK